MPSQNRPSRRAFLGAVGVSLAGVAGCSGSDSPADESTPSAGSESPSTTADQSETTRPPTRTTDGDSSTTEATTTTTSATPAWFDGYETTTVTVETPEGERLGTLTAAIADTTELRYLGLSDAPSLPPDTGMLFTYDAPAERAFVMRRMSFGIDIVYADSDGVITKIHHAPEPGPNEDGNDQRYPGYGQYVLETPYEWTTENGIETGDVLSW